MNLQTHKENATTALKCVNYCDKHNTFVFALQIRANILQIESAAGNTFYLLSIAMNCQTKYNS